jgi:hypothetical protein
MSQGHHRRHALAATNYSKGTPARPLLLVHRSAMTAQHLLHRYYPEKFVQALRSLLCRCSRWNARL